MSRWAESTAPKEKGGLPDHGTYPPLLLKAWAGDLAGVEDLIQQGTDLEAVDSNERTALTLAAANGHTAVLWALIQAGAAIDQEDSCGGRPLDWASLEGHSECISVLLRCGVSCQHRDGTGRTPLILAAIKGHEGAVLELLRGCSPEVVAAVDANGRTALHWAACQGHQAVVEAIKSRHLNLAATVGLQEDLSGCTPVGIAAMYGRPGIVSQFVEAVRLSSGEQSAREAVLHAAEAARTGGVLELAEALLAQASKRRRANISSIPCTSDVLRMSMDGGPNLEGSSVFLPLPHDSPKPDHSSHGLDSVSPGQAQGIALSVKDKDFRTDSHLVQEAFVDLRFASPAKWKGVSKDLPNRGESHPREPKPTAIPKPKYLAPPAQELSEDHLVIKSCKEQLEEGGQPSHTKLVPRLGLELQLPTSPVGSQNGFTPKPSKLPTPGRTPCQNSGPKRSIAGGTSATPSPSYSLTPRLSPPSSTGHAVASPRPPVPQRRRSSDHPFGGTTTPRKPWRAPGVPSATFPAVPKTPSKMWKVNGRPRKRACCSIPSNKTSAPVADILGYACLACLERALTSKERNANSADADGRMPLVVACYAGDLAVVKLLLDKGANPSMTGICGLDAFRAGCQSGHLPVLSCLFRHVGSHVDRTAMVDGVAGSDLPPPIVLASVTGRDDIVRWLLHHGAKISIQGPSGRTAAHVAVAQKRWAVLKLLVRYGTDMLVKDSQGETVRSLMEKHEMLDFEGRQALQLVRGSAPDDVMPVEVSLRGPQGIHDQTRTRARPFRALLRLTFSTAVLPLAIPKQLGRAVRRPAVVFTTSACVAAALIAARYPQNLKWGRHREGERD